MFETLPSSNRTSPVPPTPGLPFETLEFLPDLEWVSPDRRIRLAQKLALHSSTNISASGDTIVRKDTQETANETTHGAEVSEQSVEDRIERVLRAAPEFTDFEKTTRLESHAPLPRDWMIAVADVVDSTGAIKKGGYKAVNMTGAAVIAAAVNRVGQTSLPFVFSGDGAALALPEELAPQIAEALADVRTWVGDELGLTLRVALVPMADIQSAGHDVRLGRYAPSDGVWYAVFSGGGLAWAEAQMKSGHYQVVSEQERQPPDLEGLSCRWSRIDSQHGVVVSLILRDPTRRGSAAFLKSVRHVIARAATVKMSARPVPLNGPGVDWPPEGLELEARLSRGRQTLGYRRLLLHLHTALSWFVFRFNVKLGGFDPARYRSYLSKNADFQKYDDGLKMTLDCPVELADQIESDLEAAAKEGILEYGLFRQSQAMMTCLVPSVMTDRHFHFIDGADGGYAMAARQLKERYVLTV